MISPLSVRYSSEPILLRVYANGEGEGGDEGEQGDHEGGGHGFRGGGGDEGGGHGFRGRGDDNQGNDDGERHFRKFFNFKELERDNEHKKDTKKETAEPKPKTYDGYNFAKEGDKERKEFNFAAVGDFGCSQNTKKTINSIEEKKPELVLPLGDLSYHSPCRLLV